MTINPDGRQSEKQGSGASAHADQALVSDGAQLHGLHPSGFDPSRWRDVSSELPPNCVSVLVIWQWNKVNKNAGALSHQVLWFDLGIWFGVHGEPQDEPTHWMPLPVAPLHAIRIEAGTGGTVKHGPTRSARAGAEGIAQNTP